MCRNIICLIEVYKIGDEVSKKIFDNLFDLNNRKLLQLNGYPDAELWCMKTTKLRSISLILRKQF